MIDNQIYNLKEEETEENQRAKGSLIIELMKESDSDLTSSLESENQSFIKNIENNV